MFNNLSTLGAYMSKRRWWWWSILGLIGLYLLMMATRCSPIEKDIQARTEAALTEKGHDWAKVTLDGRGRDIMLNGVAPSEAARTEAIETATAVYGARIVENGISIKEYSTPVFGLNNEDGKTILTGSFPEQGLIDTTLRAASDNFGPENVVNRMTVSNDVSAPTWLSSALSVLPTITGMDDADFDITNEGATLNGTFHTEEEKQAFAALATDKLSGKFTDSSVVVPLGPTPEELAEIARAAEEAEALKIAEEKRVAAEAEVARMAKEANSVAEAAKLAAAALVAKVAVEAPATLAEEVSLADIEKAKAEMAEVKRLADIETAKAEMAEVKRLADIETAKAEMAEVKRLADIKTAKAEMAEVKRLADIETAKAEMAEVKRLADIETAKAEMAEVKRLADIETAKAEMAEVKRLADIETAKAEMAEVKRLADIETAKAEMTEVKRLADIETAKAEMAEVKRLADIETAKAEMAEVKRLADIETAKAEMAEVKRLADIETAKAEMAEVKRLADIETAKAEMAEVKRLADIETAKAEMAEVKRLADIETAKAEMAEVKRLADIETAKAEMAEAAALEEAERMRVEEAKAVLAAQKAAALAELESCQNQLNNAMNGNSILFATSSSKINTKSYPLLDTIALTARECGDTIISNAQNIEISGHTDSRGADTMNLTLSESRAKAVRDYLLGKGVRSSVLTSKGYGEVNPVATNDTAAGRQLNRRIQFTIQ
ncbi:OmpA family protein [Leucothrix arctica]|uniref:OmpA-like domain-containing protein n=1 Tax=Leucothrix arctica TaxID=1481894 RepID=A0A317CGD7_9GAMM|nr:OmpA family protein [Leucothrix arctica]PWQ97586.1 hypothetical protein DKT75_06615 [Leucothrix arctica]